MSEQWSGISNELSHYLPDHWTLSTNHSNMPIIPTTPITDTAYAEKITAIVAITQLCKYYGTPSKYLPLVAIITGILLEYSENPTADGILRGIIIGATTTGGFGVIKNAAVYTLEPKTKKITQNIFELEPDEDRGV